MMVYMHTSKSKIKTRSGTQRTQKNTWNIYRDLEK